MSGVLYVVATPIGNLDDITYRAVRVLGEVDVIACEDTRHSRTLLDHYQIRRPTISYYRENEAARSQELVARLLEGGSVALVSDAGAPLLSDPGARLVEAAIAAGVRVVPLPGASAVLTALMASGLGEPFAFVGFLPARAGERRRRLEEWAGWPGALVCFEAPHRLVAALADAEEILGGTRRLIVARELTKLHEEFRRGSIAEARAHFAVQAPRGEFTLVVGPASGPAPAPGLGAGLELSPELTKADLKRLARETGMGKSELYRRWQQVRGKIKD